MAKILFIEDETALQKTLSAVMEQAGHTVVNAYDGEKGLELAQEAAPDLILLDLILPKMDGFSVLEKLKGDEKTKDIPVTNGSQRAEARPLMNPHTHKA